VDTNEKRFFIRVAIMPFLLAVAGIFLISHSFSLLDEDIFNAVEKGNLCRVKALLINDVTLVKAKNKTGDTPLHRAVFFGHLDIVKLLLEKNSPVNIANDMGRTPMHWAAAYGHGEIAELLHKNKAKLNMLDVNGWSPLHFASQAGRIDTVKWLLIHGAQVNAKDKKTSSTPLQLACFRGHKEIVELLIESGAEINTKDQDGFTPLSFAVKNGDIDLVNILLSNGAESEARDSQYGRTALHIAAIKGCLDVVESLVNGGAEINAKDSQGRTPIFYAQKYGHKKVEELFRAKGECPEKLKEYPSPHQLLHKELKEKEAIIWYLYHCGWAVKTKNHFLIFDYWEPGRKPSEPSLVNGYINPEEVMEQDVIVFVSHEHPDHFDPVIFDWDKYVKAIVYVLGWQAHRGSQYIYMEGRDKKEINDVKIFSIPSIDSGVAYLVHADGLTIYHSGDHSPSPSTQQIFKKEIDFLAKRSDDIDIVFNTGRGDGVLYVLEKFRPKMYFPQHHGGMEYLLEKDIGYVFSESDFQTCVFYPENRGDIFFYPGSIR